jgi:excisionase family DNA binding protein
MKHVDYEKKQHFLKISEAAVEINVSQRKVWRLLADEQLRAHRFGNSTRVSRADLDDYIARSRQPKKVVPKRRKSKADVTKQLELAVFRRRSLNGAQIRVGRRPMALHPEVRLKELRRYRRSLKPQAG